MMESCSSNLIMRENSFKIYMIKHTNPTVTIGFVFHSFTTFLQTETIPISPKHTVPFLSNRIHFVLRSL
ncbi:putative major intrinsic protein [Helianthus annuus]|nr:putative major intrinsic protein [Helianthus annuus]